jgi:formate hydrogenlyase subunit 3/multisubunit Na+/H+ antiporter MnhD subunit
MQTPLVSPSSRGISQNSILHGRLLSIVWFCAASALFLIAFAVLFAQDGTKDFAGRGILASSEFSSGMPLP